MSLAHPLLYPEHTDDPPIGDHHNEGRTNAMYNRPFFQTKLGQAAMASIAAMCAFVALTTQMQVDPAFAAVSPIEAVELA
jgi:hypothetical protein